jgi:hypothetical protein
VHCGQFEAPAAMCRELDCCLQVAAQQPLLCICSFYQPRLNAAHLPAVEMMSPAWPVTPLWPCLLPSILSTACLALTVTFVLCFVMLIATAQYLSVLAGMHLPPQWPHPSPVMLLHSQLRELFNTLQPPDILLSCKCCTRIHKYKAKQRRVASDPKPDSFGNESPMLVEPLLYIAALLGLHDNNTVW